MRRASASRASNATRGICFALSNRQPDLLKHNLSHCKKTKSTRSNREVSTKTFLTDVTHRKQSPQKFLTGGRSSFSDPATHHTKNRSNLGFLPHDTLSRPPIPNATEAGLNRQIHELELNLPCRKQKDSALLKSPKNQEMPERVFDRFSICANSSEEPECPNRK
jgi:hypothetical protein